jgi:hypothetical protein
MVKLEIKIVSLLLTSIMLFFVGCKKNNSENETPDEPSNETLDELIPEEILQILDNCPVTNYQDPSVFGFNGKLKRLKTSHYTGIVKVEEIESIDTSNIIIGDIIYYLGTNNDDYIGMFKKQS